MVKWKDYFNRIPASVKVNKSTYEVHWIDSFPKDKEQLGESRFNDNEREIVIKLGQNDKETVKTYWHELCHVASEEYGINLTENQVLKLENFLKDVLTPGNIFKKGNKSEANKRKRRYSKRIR